MATSLALFAEIASLDHGLVVVSAQRGDGTIVASLVNAGVMQHPLDGDEVVAFVARGLRKLEHLRRDNHVTVVARSGWRWAGVEGLATVIGPDDPHPGVDAEALRLLLRDVFTAAGGTHDDWDAYDKTMADDRSAVVLVKPTRTYPAA
jgi:PPOX class probable F420-dependent enzyme